MSLIHYSQMAIGRVRRRRHHYLGFYMCASIFTLEIVTQIEDIYGQVYCGKISLDDSGIQYLFSTVFPSYKKFIFHDLHIFSHGPKFLKEYLLFLIDCSFVIT